MQWVFSVFTRVACFWKGKVMNMVPTDCSTWSCVMYSIRWMWDVLDASKNCEYWACAFFLTAPSAKWDIVRSEHRYRIYTDISWKDMQLDSACRSTCLTFLPKQSCHAKRRGRERERVWKPSRLVTFRIRGSDRIFVGCRLHLRSQIVPTHAHHRCWKMMKDMQSRAGLRHQVCAKRLDVFRHRDHWPIRKDMITRARATILPYKSEQLVGAPLRFTCHVSPIQLLDLPGRLLDAKALISIMRRCSSFVHLI